MQELMRMRSPKPTLGRLFSALVLPLCLGVLSMSLAPPPAGPARRPIA